MESAVSTEGDENEDLQSILESSNVKVDIVCRRAAGNMGVAWEG